jgi:hypothetical protein
VNASEAQTLLSTFDPALQEAGEAVAAELPMEPDQRMQFGILAILSAIAAIVTIVQFCRSRRGVMSGVALKESAHTLTTHGRHLVRRRVHQAIKKSGEFHGFWDLKRQTDEMTSAILRTTEKAEPGRIEATVQAAMRQAATLGEA